MTSPWQLIIHSKAVIHYLHCMGVMQPGYSSVSNNHNSCIHTAVFPISIPADKIDLMRDIMALIIVATVVVIVAFDGKVWWNIHV